MKSRILLERRDGRWCYVHVVDGVEKAAYHDRQVAEAAANASAYAYVVTEGLKHRADICDTEGTAK